MAILMQNMNKKKLLTAIDKYLPEKPPKPQSGWPEVTSQDEEELWILINAIIECKFSHDADGDYPMRFKLVNRTKFEPMHYSLVPYEHKVKSKKEYIQRFQTLMTNVAIANDSLRSESRRMEEFLESENE